VDFELSEEQLGLRDSTRRLLAASADVAATRKVIESGAGFDGSLWRKGADLGWPALALPEELDGFGQQLVDLAVVATEHGRAVLPSPFLPTVVAADAIATSTNVTLRQEIAPQLAAGTATASWAFAEPGQPWSAAGLGLRASRDGDGFTLDGKKIAVQDASAAQWLLVDAALDGAPARFVTGRDTAGLTIRRQQAFDITRELDDITLAGVRLPAVALLSRGEEARRSIERSLRMITVLACAELVGVAERLLAMTIEHVKVREQFGRPIGGFQAIKHKCATMRIWAEASAAATWYAAMAVDAGTEDCDRAVSVAKAYVGDAVSRLAGEALQAHGGIGFTWEHDLHLYLRRAKSNELLYGDPGWHRERLCQLLEAANPGPGPLDKLQSANSLCY
jgi:alkylation response protein AidB-like acyl-CoA dehydrogenase